MSHQRVPKDNLLVAINTLVSIGKYPSGRSINRLLHRNGSYLSSVEREWRRIHIQELKQLGIKIPKREGFKT